jgi:hypothetical protein
MHAAESLLGHSSPRGYLPAMGATRRAVVYAGCGALVLAIAVAVTEATRQWRDWGCAAPNPAPPCVRPRLWHWSDVDPLLMLVGAVVGAGIAVGLVALAQRERRRRREFGDE